MPHAMREAAREAAERLREPEDAALRVNPCAHRRRRTGCRFRPILARERQGAAACGVSLVRRRGGGGAASGGTGLPAAGAERERAAVSRCSPQEPCCRSRRWPEAAAGLGHVKVAFDRDGAPRYEYLAVPFDARLRAVAVGPRRRRVSRRAVERCRPGARRRRQDRRVYLSRPIPRCGWLSIIAARAGTMPTYSFATLIEGQLDPALFKDRIVVIGASFTGISDAYPGPFNNTPMPGTERLANVIDTILARDFIREYPPPWPWIAIGAVALLAIGDRDRGGAAADPVRGARPASCRCSAGPGACSWPLSTGCGFRRRRRSRHCRRPAAACCCSATALSTASAAACRARFGNTSRPRWSRSWPSIPERLQLGGETRPLTIMFADIRGFTPFPRHSRATLRASAG